MKTDDWPLDDPKGQTPDRVRAIRDQIEELVVRLIAVRRSAARATASGQLVTWLLTAADCVA